MKLGALGNGPPSDVDSLDLERRVENLEKQTSEIVEALRRYIEGRKAPQAPPKEKVTKPKGFGVGLLIAGVIAALALARG